VIDGKWFILIHLYLHCLKYYSEDNFVYCMVFIFCPKFCTHPTNKQKVLGMLLVRRIKPFFIIVTSYQERSTCLCGYAHTLMFGCGWRSLYRCLWSLTSLCHIMYLLLQGVMWTNQEFFSKATILCTIPWEDIWQHFCKSCP